MAIVFTKDISSDKLLMAYNNNIVTFHSDSLSSFPRNCAITGLGLNVLLYPDPNGHFRFDFKEYASALVNTKRFTDDLITDLIDGDSNTFTYDVTDGCYLDGNVTFTITMTDDTTDEVSRTVAFLAGVVQLEDFKRQEIPTNGNYVVLSPVQSRTSNTVNLKYWEGYPFEFSFYTSFPTSAFLLQNISTGQDFEFAAKGKVTSLSLSDGRTNVTLDDFLPLVDGMNLLHIVKEGEDQGINIFLEKFDAGCGVYLKWLNHLGRWNYWLLNKNTFRDLSSKYEYEIDNDFDNLEDTTSPTLQSGKTSGEVLRCNVKKLTRTDREVFKGLFTSPKILMFTGERYSRAAANDWLEITMKTSNFRTEDTQKVLFDYKLDFDLPAQYSQNL